jgi:protein ImuB
MALASTYKNHAVDTLVLWLCIRLPQLPLEALAGTRARTRQPHAERAALARLALWAQQWSSHVSSAPAHGDDNDDDAGHESDARADATLWLEIAASLKLFGGHAALRAAVTAALTQLGYSGEIAIAPTPQAARLLTRTGEPRVVLHIDGLQPRLAALPMKLLALPAAVIAALRAAGLRRMGEVLALPPAALARRFGPETSRYLQRLLGTLNDPLPATPLPAQYRSHCEFAAEVTSTTVLLFPLQRLLGELQGYLRARDCALQRWQLRLTHHRHPDTCLTLCCSRPSRDAAQLLMLARERLNATVLAAAVQTLHLEADEFTSPVVLQSDFFTRDAESAQQLAQVLDRLRARLGTDSVQVTRSFPDYRPEHAWRTANAGQGGVATGFDSLPVTRSVKTRCGTTPNYTVDAPRPCWLLPQPIAVTAPHTVLSGPERVESGWWDGGDVARDYYLVRGSDGARQWIFQDLRSHQWFLHGLWS